MKEQNHKAKVSQPAPDLLRLTNGLVTRDFLLQVPISSQPLVVNSLSIPIVSSLHLQHGTCTAWRRIPRFCELFLRRLVSLSRHQGERCTIRHSPIISTYSTFPCQPQVSKGSECDSGRCGRGRCTRLSQPNRTEGEGSACEGPQPHLCLLLGEEHQVKLIFLFLYCLMSLHCF